MVYKKFESMAKFCDRFNGEIIQEYGRVDHGLSIHPQDKRDCIVDDPQFEDPKERKDRLLTVVTEFLIQVKRIKVDDSTKWYRVEQMALKEPEHLVKKNITFEEIVPGFEYWTREGKITRMIIQKPVEEEHFDDLHRWTAVLFYDEFHTNWKITDVESLLDDDRYIVAWYALWRKWPIQYKVWEWAGRFKEVRNPFKAPNYSDHFKKHFMKEIEEGRVKLIPKERFWKWQRHQLCTWDDFNWFYRDPSEIVSKDYQKIGDYDSDVLGKHYKEWLKVRNMED